MSPKVKAFFEKYPQFDTDFGRCVIPELVEIRQKFGWHETKCNKALRNACREHGLTATESAAVADGFMDLYKDI